MFAGTARVTYVESRSSKPERIMQLLEKNEACLRTFHEYQLTEYSVKVRISSPIDGDISKIFTTGA